MTVVFYFYFFRILFNLIRDAQNGYYRIMDARATTGTNVVSDYFASTGDSFHNYIDGWCGPLTYAVSSWLKQRGISHKRLLIVRGKDGKYLHPTAKSQPQVIHYHAVIVIDGYVHCPWLDERVTLEAYCAKMFPEQKFFFGEDYSRFTEKEAANDR